MIGFAWWEITRQCIYSNIYINKYSCIKCSVCVRVFTPRHTLNPSCIFITKVLNDEYTHKIGLINTHVYANTLLNINTLWSCSKNSLLAGLSLRQKKISHQRTGNKLSGHWQ